MGMGGREIMMAGSNSEDARRRERDHPMKMALSGGEGRRRNHTGWSGLDEARPRAKADGRVVPFQRKDSLGR